MKPRRLITFTLAIVCGHVLPAFAGQDGEKQPAALRFEVTLAEKFGPEPKDGRLFIVLGKRAQPEPRHTLGTTGLQAPPVLGHDISGFKPGMVGVIDANAVIFPLDRLADLPAGEYFAQALFHWNQDLYLPNAPGNFYSQPQKVRLNPAENTTVKLELTEQLPPEELPKETEYVKFVKLKSELLSKFHGRPIYLRAGVILPRDFEKESQRHYPLWVRIGGYGSRYTGVQRMMERGGFRRLWLADDTPRMILLHLDGAGPYGDPYQVNSENNGPYGDAITQELIPYIEEKYRGIGQPYARVLDGGSTGGWVSLALQVFYPDFFNGTWSGYPDGVDFRAFQLIDVYKDDNAYVNRHGFERPSMRERDGDVAFTVRHECQMENILGRGDSWTMSGGQWGAWNATYGPRGRDGRPVPLWEPWTGKINRAVVDHWKQYDLRMVLEQNWKTLGPKLRGKLHIWVGEADEYFLNNAVHLLDDFLSKAEPPYEGTIQYGPRAGHGWTPFGEKEMMQQMAETIEKARPQKN